MDGQAPAGGPAPAGASGGPAPALTVWERFLALVHGAGELGDDERERVLEMGLGALRGDAGPGVL